MIFSPIFGFIIGAILGSFVDATSNRLVNDETLKGRSRCESCKKTLGFLDLIPLFSYLYLNGKCRYCKAHIPKETFIVETLTGLSIAIIFLTSTSLQEIIFKCFVTVILEIVFITDFKSGYIFDLITYPSTLIALLWLVIFGVYYSFGSYFSLQQSNILAYLQDNAYFYNQLLLIWKSIGFAVLSGIGASLFFVFLILITKGRGMGWGDVKFVFFLGIVLGFPNIILGLFLAFLLGSVFSIVLIFLKKKSFGATIPFGPFLSAAAYISLIFGDQILALYISKMLGY